MEHEKFPVLNLGKMSKHSLGYNGVTFLGPHH